MSLNESDNPSCRIKTCILFMGFWIFLKALTLISISKKRHCESCSNTSRICFGSLLKNINNKIWQLISNFLLFACSYTLHSTCWFTYCTYSSSCFNKDGVGWWRCAFEMYNTTWFARASGSSLINIPWHTSTNLHPCFNSNMALLAV